jgi:hypothetical protein
MTWKSRTSKRIPMSTSTTALNLGKTPLHECTHRLQTPQREPASSKQKNHPSTYRRQQKPKSNSQVHLECEIEQNRKSSNFKEKDFKIIIIQSLDLRGKTHPNQRKAPNSEEEGKKEGLTNKPLPLLWSSFSP